MTAANFYKLVLSLWGEDWRPTLRELLAEHGYPVTRQTLWNWQKGKTSVPERVGVILKAEKKRRATEN